MKVRKKRSMAWLPLHFEPKRSLHQIILGTMTDLKKTCQINEDEQHLIRVTKLHHDATDVWGVVEVGDYGYAAPLLHSKTLLTSYNKTIDEAEMLPLYFRFHLPDAGSIGIFIVQRFGNRGAFSAVKAAMNERFEQLAPDFHLGIERFVPTSVMESLTHGGVREMQITTHTIPQDLADKVLLGGAKKSVAKVEFRIVAHAGTFLTMNAADWLKKLEKKGTHILETPDETPTIRVKVDYKGRDRMYDLQKMDVVAPYVDITEEVERTGQGHPKFDSIDSYAIDLRDELLDQLGLEK